MAGHDPSLDWDAFNAPLPEHTQIGKQHSCCSKEMHSMLSRSDSQGKQEILDNDQLLIPNHNVLDQGKKIEDTSGAASEYNYFEFINDEPWGEVSGSQ